MDRKPTRQRQESIEVEIIPPHASHHSGSAHVTQVEKESQRKSSPKRNKKVVVEKVETIQETVTSDEWGILDNSSDYNTLSTSKPEKDDKKYCEFCGALLEEQVGALLAQRRKYCSPRCRSIATGRRTRARLGV